MGLQERRAQKEFEEKVLPGLKEEVASAAGFDVEIEVDWPAICVDGYAHMYEEFWKKVYFQPLISALAAVAVDDMGKEALKEGLKKIVIKNEKGNYYGDGMASLDGGVLSLDHQPESNVDSIDERSKGIQKHLEENL